MVIARDFERNDCRGSADGLIDILTLYVLDKLIPMSGFADRQRGAADQLALAGGEDIWDVLLPDAWFFPDASSRTF